MLKGQVKSRVVVTLRVFNFPESLQATNCKHYTQKSSVEATNGNTASLFDVPLLWKRDFNRTKFTA